MAINDSIKFSVVIPLYNEEGNVTVFHKELVSVLEGYDYELVYVNDGSTDSTNDNLKKGWEKIGKFRNL